MSKRERYKQAGGLGKFGVERTVTFSNTSGTVTIFTVTGDVVIKLNPVITTSLASAGGCNAKVGIAGDLDSVLPDTDVTTMGARSMWHDDVPDSEIEPLDTIRDYCLTNGNDIILTLSAQVDSGVIIFYLGYSPMDKAAVGRVIAA